jgi:predicted MPP superfamily phosphohydrolase
MDVHHHSHTERKKWAHYFWEFLMLFLAVFCGFLAENQRRHMVEHQREKQYMGSLLSDLAADTTVLSNRHAIKT